jgi:hypothetical protein
MAANADPKVALQKVLNTLYDRPIQIANAPKFEPAFAKPAVLAVYASDDNTVTGLAVCSMSAAAYLGASLSLLPKPVADDCVKRGALEDTLLENFREVANICCSLFAEQLGARAHLQTVVAKCTAVPAEYKALMASPNRADVTIDVPNYGQGIVSIRLAKVVPA